MFSHLLKIGLRFSDTAEWPVSHAADERKRQGATVQLAWFQGMWSSMRLLGQPSAKRWSVRGSQALASTAFILAVWTGVAMVAQVRPPPSEPAKSAFFLTMAWSLMARSPTFESILMRPSPR